MATEVSLNVQKMKELMEDPQVRSWRAVLNSYKTMMRTLEESMQDFEGCSLSRFQILLNLYFNGSMRPVEIAEKLQVTRGNITMFLKRMVQDELIEKEFSSGKVRPRFRLTDKGVSCFEEIFPCHIAKVKETFPQLDDPSVAKLNRFVESSRS